MALQAITSSNLAQTAPLTRILSLISISLDVLNIYHQYIRQSSIRHCKFTPSYPSICWRELGLLTGYSWNYKRAGAGEGSIFPFERRPWIRSSPGSIFLFVLIGSWLATCIAIIKMITKRYFSWVLMPIPMKEDTLLKNSALFSVLVYMYPFPNGRPPAITHKWTLEAQ